jgi:hypothetical protein
MPLDPQLLTQVLRTPDTEDVTQSSIVNDVILRDPANAADLVAALQAGDALEASNARLILCQFDSRAAPWLLTELANAGLDARQQILEVLWTVLITETPTTIRESLGLVKAKLNMLLDDRTALPDLAPDYIERDFSGRLCDLVYIVIQQLLSPNFDQSLFRSLDDAGRDAEITALKRSDLSDTVA